MGQSKTCGQIRQSPEDRNTTLGARATTSRGMTDLGKRNVLGVLVDALDYDAALDRLLSAARHGRSLGASALAVHGVMEAARDPVLRYRVNHLELVTPDGQPVRWALNLLHGARLKDRVYGPTLMRKLLERAAAEQLPVYLYGSTSAVLDALVDNLRRRFPALAVAGREPSQFRLGTPAELDEIAARISASGARLVFVGLGCPRQEVLTHELSRRLAVPVLAVGAAFDYHAGFLREPPAVVQRVGLQWLWRLVAEPRRLWRRYCLLNPAYAVRVAAQAAHLLRPSARGVEPPADCRVAI